jgi:hypothetical protein
MKLAELASPPAEAATEVANWASAVASWVPINRIRKAAANRMPPSAKILRVWFFVSIILPPFLAALWIP